LPDNLQTFSREFDARFKVWV